MLYVFPLLNTAFPLLRTGKLLQDNTQNYNRLRIWNVFYTTVLFLRFIRQFAEDKNFEKCLFRDVALS